MRRTSARTCSPGTGSTRPERTSSRRRIASAVQSCSISSASAEARLSTSLSASRALDVGGSRIASSVSSSNVSGMRKHYPLGVKSSKRFEPTHFQGAHPDTAPVSQTSKSAVSRVSQPANRTKAPAPPTWKSAIQQVWKPALPTPVPARLGAVSGCAHFQGHAPNRNRHSRAGANPAQSSSASVNFHSWTPTAQSFWSLTARRNAVALTGSNETSHHLSLAMR